MNIYTLAKKIISRIENTGIPFLNYILTFLSIITIRIFLEFFSDTARLSFKFFPASSTTNDVGIAISLAHFYLFWIALWLGFVLITTCLTKENITKTGRAILGFSWIIIITPLFDLFISQGKGIPIKYITPNSFLGLLPLPQAVNYGEKVTLVLGLILIFIYCMTKINNVLKSLAGVFLFYILSMLSFMPPFLMEQTASIFNINFKVISPIPIIRLLLIITLVEMIVIVYLWNKRRFAEFLKQIDLLKFLHFVLFFIAGMLLLHSRVERFLVENFGSFLLTITAVFLSWVVTTILNKKDTNAPDKESYSRSMAAGIFIFALVCAGSVNSSTAFIILLGTANYIVYSLSPLKLKQIPLLSKLPAAANILLSVFLGWLFAGGELQRFPHVFTFYILIFGTLGLNILDLNNDNTPAAMLSVKLSKLLTGISLAASYLLLPLLFLEKRLFFIYLPLAIIQLYFINRCSIKKILLLNLAALLILVIWLNFLRKTCPIC